MKLGFQSDPTNSLLPPHVILRFDFRETLSSQPDFWSESHQKIRDFPFGPGVTVEPQPVILQGL